MTRLCYFHDVPLVTAGGKTACPQCGTSYPKLNTEGETEMTLKLRVVSKNMKSGEIEIDKVIDHDNRDDRVWLGKHCFWAFRSGRSITTEPLLREESEREDAFDPTDPASRMYENEIQG